MKIIDLLNKIANGEEVPKKIRFDGTYWNRICGEKYTYYIDEDNDNDLFIYFFRKNLTFNLNDEVEIIEDKKIEKFKDYIPIGLTSVGADFRKKDVFEALLKIGDKINEIIDRLNKEK